MPTDRLPCKSILGDQIANAAKTPEYYEYQEDTGMYVARGDAATVTMAAEGNSWMRIQNVETQTPKDYDAFVEALWDEFLNKAVNYQQNRWDLDKENERSIVACQNKQDCHCAKRLQSAPTFLLDRMPCIDIQEDAIVAAAQNEGYFETLEYRTWKVNGALATVTIFDKGNGWTDIEKVETSTPEDGDKFVEDLWDHVLNQSAYSHQQRNMLAETTSSGRCLRQGKACECARRLAAANQEQPALS